MQRITTRRAAALLTSATLLCSAPALADDRNVMIVYDASGSMWGQIDGKAKIEIAREVLADLVQQWPAGTNLGLIAYGHRQQTSCTDIETLVRPGPVDAKSFLPRINQIKPLGRTPLTAAVQHAATELSYQDAPATVVLISDGAETCNADPCALSKELAEKGVAFTAHVVGFDLKSGEHEKLACIAENTGGLFVAAQNAQELQQALHDIQAEIVQTPAPEPEPAPAPEPQVTIELPEAVQAATVFELSWSQTLHPHNRFAIVDQDGKRVRESGVLNASTQGTLHAPATPGQYEVRYMAGDRIAGRATLEVVPVGQTITAPAEVQAGQTFSISWTQTLHPHNLVVIVPAGVEGRQRRTTEIYDQEKRSNRNIGAPTTPGDYEIRYMSGDTVMASTPLRVVPVEQVITAPAQVQTGQDFPISWTQTLHPHNLVVIVPAGVEGSQRKTTEIYDQEKRSNRSINSPTTPGDYEIRYIAKDTVMASTPLKVVQATQSLTARNIVLADTQFEVSWGQQLRAGDTVALVPVGATDAKSAITSGRAEHNLKRKLRAPKEPGRFELLYIAAHSGDVLARKPIEVVVSMTAEQAAAAQPSTVGAVPAPLAAPTPTPIASPTPVPVAAASATPVAAPVAATAPAPTPAAPAATPESAATNNAALPIGLVSNAGYRYLDGAGCTYQAPGAKFDYDDQSTWQYLFIADAFGGTKRGWLHAGGQIIEVGQTQTGAPADPKSGQRYTDVYQAGDLRVSLSHEVTATGDGASWEIKGEMHVEQAGREARVAVQGECGS